MMESELKAKSEHIRTIIKARGINYPNFTGKTFAVFRVDNRHHLMSIVSMIDPSPDWIVGVSSLELCLRNCSWIESKTLNLYPWDVGTDDGVTYLSPNQPSSPRQPIRRIKPNSSNDTKSPFYDPTGAPIKPLAKLYLSRQRLYEKACDPTAENSAEDDNGNCQTTEWSEWSPCSATCGRGVKYKQRKYINEESKYVCRKKLTQRAGCEALQKYCPTSSRHEPAFNPICELSDWSEWSSCSVTCGKGTTTRDRRYKNRNAAKTCAAGREHPPKLEENMECYGESEDCEEEALPSKSCRTKMWSEWSPCSVTCGEGTKERFLLTIGKDKKLIWPVGRKDDFGEVDEEDLEDECYSSKVKETVTCYQPSCEVMRRLESAAICSLRKDEGDCRTNVDRWYFDQDSGMCEIFSYSGCGGNANNFRTSEDCENICTEYRRELLLNRTHELSLPGAISNIQNDGTRDNCLNSTRRSVKEGIIIQEKPKIDCEMSSWSQWSECNVNESCGQGYKTKHRYIKVYPANGGRACPKKLIKHKRCKRRCPNGNEASGRKKRAKNTDCVMGQWSSWSPCSKTCGFGSIQKRFRTIFVHPKGFGRKCGMKTETRICPYVECLN